MQLIDADKLIEQLCLDCDMSACDGLGRNSTAKCYSVRVVEEQPTAFDVDKVVEQLGNGARNYYPSIDHYCLSRKAVGYREAISIVKAGGVNE